VEACIFKRTSCLSDKRILFQWRRIHFRGSSLRGAAAQDLNENKISGGEFER
jgi:hypothetical protein